jgi:hypothetical protein
VRANCKHKVLALLSNSLLAVLLWTYGGEDNKAYTSDSLARRFHTEASEVDVLHYLKTTSTFGDNE